MSQKSSPTDYTEEETRLRVEAAVRGARIAGHKPMKGAPKKRRPSTRKKPRKPRA